MTYAFEKKCEEEYPGIVTVLVDEDNGDPVTGLQKFEDDLKAQRVERRAHAPFFGCFRLAPHTQQLP